MRCSKQRHAHWGTGRMSWAHELLVAPPCIYPPGNSKLAAIHYFRGCIKAQGPDHSPPKPLPHTCDGTSPGVQLQPLHSTHHQLRARHLGRSHERVRQLGRVHLRGSWPVKEGHSMVKAWSRARCKRGQRQPLWAPAQWRPMQYTCRPKPQRAPICCRGNTVLPPRCVRTKAATAAALLPPILPRSLHHPSQAAAPVRPQGAHALYALVMLLWPPRVPLPQMISQSIECYPIAHNLMLLPVQWYLQCPSPPRL